MAGDGYRPVWWVGTTLALLVRTAVSAEPQPSAFITDPAAPLTQRAAVALSQDKPDSPLTDLTPALSRAQRSPFDTPIDVVFDAEETVGQAVSRLLGVIGYDLYVSGKGIDPMAAVVFRMPLPDVHRRFDGVSLRDSLHALIGDGYVIVVDHNRRAVSADVSPGLRRYQAARALRQAHR